MSQPPNNLIAIKSTGDILRSGKAKYKNLDYEGAIAEYTIAIEFSPHIALAFCCRGDAYYKLGVKQEALNDYNRAITSGRLRQRTRSYSSSKLL